MYFLPWPKFENCFLFPTAGQKWNEEFSKKECGEHKLPPTPQNGKTQETMNPKIEKDEEASAAKTTRIRTAPTPTSSWQNQVYQRHLRLLMLNSVVSKL